MVNLHATRLAQLPLFRGVPTPDLTELGQHLVGRALTRGQELYAVGAPARDACFVLAGRLGVRLGGSSEAQPFADCWPGDVIGEAGLLDPSGCRNAGVVAMMDSEIVLLSREMFVLLPHNKAVVAIERQLLTAMARRIRAANTRLEQAWKAPSLHVKPHDAPTEPPSAVDSLRVALLRILGGTA